MFNLTLRKRIFLSYFILFSVFVILLFPFANQLVKTIIIKSMDDQVTELIGRISSARNQDELILELKEEKPLIFFRVGIINDKSQSIYDTHMKRIVGPRFSQEYIIDHPEVDEAFRTGTGYHEEFSQRLNQHFAYYAKTFDFHGKTFVLRTAFPSQYVESLLRDFEIGFLTLGSFGLLLFSVVTWFSIHRLTRPIEHIITAIQPYQEGVSSSIPEISLKSANPEDEFGRLAFTLNSLSEKVQRHIDTLVEERNEKEVILQSLGEGVVAVDSFLNVLYANNFACKLLDIDKEKLVGKPFREARLVQGEELLITAQREERALSASVQRKGENGQLFLDLIAIPIKGGHGLVLVIQDKTEHHRMTRMRKDFVDNASHELKTPITIMMGFAETLHDNPDMDPEMQKQVTGKILRNAQRMDTVIQDLLILSDIENLPASRLDECHLEELIEDCRDTLLSVYPDARVDIFSESEVDPLLVADKYLLELCFNNLFNNAAKYSEGDAEIKVVIRREGDEYVVSVKDKGIGIPEADLEHLFQRFYTVSKTHSRKKGGSGLGLSIVQTIVDKHFGSISAESQLGIGTTFTLRFPIHRS